MASESLDLISPLPRDECVRRLQVATDRWWALFGSRPLVGHVGESFLRVRKRIGYGNSFQCRLSATLEDEGSRTRLRCRLGMHPSVTLFMAFWFCGVVLIGAEVLVSTAAALLRGDASAQAWMGIIGPFGMLAFGVALVAFGRFLARNEREFLLNFLRATIDARPG
jgi:hypothetical protein